MRLCVSNHAGPFECIYWRILPPGRRENRCSTDFGNDSEFIIDNLRVRLCPCIYTNCVRLDTFPEHRTGCKKQSRRQRTKKGGRKFYGGATGQRSLQLNWLAREVKLVEDGVLLSQIGCDKTSFPMIVPSAKSQSPPCDCRTPSCLRLLPAVLATCKIAFLRHISYLHHSVHDVVRAFTPWGASCCVGGKRWGHAQHNMHRPRSLGGRTRNSDRQSGTVNASQDRCHHITRRVNSVAAADFPSRMRFHWAPK